jgi:hypothetical protein
MTDFALHDDSIGREFYAPWLKKPSPCSRFIAKGNSLLFMVLSIRS